MLISAADIPRIPDCSTYTRNDKEVARNTRKLSATPYKDFRVVSPR